MKAEGREVLATPKEMPMEQLASKCLDVARNRDITSACLYGYRVYGYSKDSSDYDILMILENYDDGVRYHYRKINGVYAAILAVHKELFELDVRNGGLGDFVSHIILAPYIPIMSSEYLQKMEVEVKKRIVMEEIENLVVGYGELARGLVIEPNYFALARMLRRTMVFPPFKSSYANMLRGESAEENMKKTMRGFHSAIQELTHAGLIRLEDGMVAIENSCIDRWMSRRTIEKMVNIVEHSQRTLYSYLTHLAGLVNVDTLARELSKKLTVEEEEAPADIFEDPKKYVFLKTHSGLVNLDVRASIKEVVSKLRPGAKITISPLSGVLNEVYLVAVDGEKLVVKKFTNWHGFKWFTLNLVALGAKTFSVSGITRLSNEYGMNRFLSENGIQTPKIIHVSLPDQVLLEEYVEGTPILKFVKKSLSHPSLSKEEEEVAFSLGETFAKVHSLNVGIGDTKPENLLLSKDSQIYILDLEQAKKMGDKAWDVAEFLYYAGHYGLTATGGFRDFVSNFGRGYVSIGEPNILVKATGLNYMKVFSFWTSPTIIYSISEVIRNEFR